MPCTVTEGVVIADSREPLVSHGCEGACLRRFKRYDISFGQGALIVGAYHTAHCEAF